MERRTRNTASMWVVLVCVTVVSCLVESENIGGDFVVKTRVYSDIGHEYSERDLYYRMILGVTRLIQRDISGAVASPSGEKVLYVARKRVGDELEGELYLFDRETKRSILIEEGDFVLEQDWWSPVGNRFVYRELFEPIVVVELDGNEIRKFPLRGQAHSFLGWSPSGARIVHSTGKSIYEENILLVTNLSSNESEEVARKEGNWYRSDFHWFEERGVETLRVN